MGAPLRGVPLQLIAWPLFLDLHRDQSDNSAEYEHAESGDSKGSEPTLRDLWHPGRELHTDDRDESDHRVSRQRRACEDTADHRHEEEKLNRLNTELPLSQHGVSQHGVNEDQQDQANQKIGVAIAL